MFEQLSLYNPAEDPLKDAFRKIRNHVLNSKRSEKGSVGFNFPTNYIGFLTALPPIIAPAPPVAPPAAPQQTPMALAAHTLHPGKLVEGVGDEHEHGKGGLIYQSVADRMPDWPENEVTQFMKNLKRYISRIGNQIGLLFETKTFMALVKGHRLKPVDGEDEVEVEARELSIIADMNAKARNKSFVNKLEVLINVHALDMASDIMQMSKNILRYCEIDQVTFQGGQGGTDFLVERGDPADIVVSCSKIRPGKYTTPQDGEHVEDEEMYKWLKDIYTAGKQKPKTQREYYLDALNELLEEKRSNPTQPKEEEEVPF